MALDYFLSSQATPFYLFCGSVFLKTFRIKQWSLKIFEAFGYQLIGTKCAEIIHGKLFGDTTSYLVWRSGAGSVHSSQRSYELQISYNLKVPAVLCWVAADGLLFHFHYIKLNTDSENVLLFEELCADHAILCLRFSGERPCHINDIRPQDVFFLYVPMQGSVRHSLTLSYSNEHGISDDNPPAVSLFHTPLATAIAPTDTVPQTNDMMTAYVPSFVHGFCVHYSTDITTFHCNLISIISDDLVQVCAELPSEMIVLLQASTSIYVKLSREISSDGADGLYVCRYRPYRQASYTNSLIVETTALRCGSLDIICHGNLRSTSSTGQQTDDQRSKRVAALIHLFLRAFLDKHCSEDMLAEFRLDMTDDKFDMQNASHSDTFLEVAKDYLQATRLLRSDNIDNLVKRSPIVAPAKKYFPVVRSVLRDHLSQEVIDKGIVESVAKAASSPIRFRAKRCGRKSTNPSSQVCVGKENGSDIGNSSRAEGELCVPPSPQPSAGVLDSVLWTVMRGITSSVHG